MIRMIALPTPPQPPPQPGCPSRSLSLSLCATSLHHSHVWQYWRRVSRKLTVQDRHPGQSVSARAAREPPCVGTHYTLTAPRGAQVHPFLKTKVRGSNTVMVKTKCFFTVAYQLLLFLGVLRSQGVASPFLSCSMAEKEEETDFSDCARRKRMLLLRFAVHQLMLQQLLCLLSTWSVGSTERGFSIVQKHRHTRDTHSLWWAEGFSLSSPSSSAWPCRNGRSQSCRACRTFWL